MPAAALSPSEKIALLRLCQQLFKGRPNEYFNRCEKMVKALGEGKMSVEEFRKGVVEMAGEECEPCKAAAYRLGELCELAKDKAACELAVNALKEGKITGKEFLEQVKAAGIDGDKIDKWLEKVRSS